jgi:conjugal transfer/type IV secretion protein DotA/TraY
MSASSSNPLAPPTSDLSVQLLDKLFGSGWQNFGGNPSGFLQEVLGVFDAALFSVLGCIALYSLVISIAEASHDGVPLGRRYGKWMPFRLVYACAFLAPVAKGISVAQIVVLYVVGAGVGLADTVYNKGMSFIVNSGPSVVANSQTGTSLAKDVLSSLVCEYWVNQNYYYMSLGNQVGLPNADGTAGASLPGASGSFVKRTTTTGSYTVTNPSSKYGPVNFFGSSPDLTVTSTKVMTTGYSFDGVSGTGLPPGVCGAFTFSYSDSLPAASSVSSTQMTALKTMMSTLAPLAKSIVGAPASASSGTPSTGSPTLPNPSPLYTAINAYQTSISAAAASAASSGTSGKDLSAWQSAAQTGGWLTAGSFYYSFAHQNSRLNALLSRKWQYQGIAVDSVADPNGNSVWSLKNVLSSVQGYTQILGQTGNFVGNPPTAAQVASASGAVSTGSSGWSRFMSVLSSPAVGIVTHLSTLMLQNGDPILTVQSFGNSVIDSGELMAAGVGVMLSAEGAANGVVAGLSKIPLIGGVAGAVAGSVTGALKSVSKLGVPFALMIILPIIVFGAGLAFLFPAIPYVFFTFGVVVWAWLILEALFAVPVWGILHAQPEGEGFLPAGVRQGYLKVLSLFIRPSLLILGFFAVFEILEVLTTMILDGFSAMVTGLTAGSLTGIVGIISMLFVLNLVLLESTRQLYKLALVDLPGSVMAWVGESGGAISHPGGSIDSVKTPSVPRPGGEAKAAAELAGEAGAVQAITSKTSQIASNAEKGNTGGGSGGSGPSGSGGTSGGDILSDPATSSTGSGGGEAPAPATAPPRLSGSIFDHVRSQTSAKIDNNDSNEGE